MDGLALIQILLIILCVGGLSLLAQWGRKNPAAEISLIVIILFLSFLLVGLGALVALVVLSGDTLSLDLPPGLFVGSAAVVVLAGLAGFALCVPPLRKVTTRRRAAYDAASPGLTGFDTAGRASEDRGLGGWWSDPPVFFALWMFVVVLASNMVGILAFALTPDEVGSALTSEGRISPFAIFAGQFPFVVVALCGVGFGIRRNLRETLARLGYGRITLPQLGMAVLFVVGAILLSFATDTLFAALQPDLYQQVGEVSEGIFGTEGLSPVSAVLFALLIGIGAGLGEETLFRGAIQPALGITLVSILWASMHVQYGPSLLLIYIFIISVGLGFLRKRYNTTVSFLAHAGYNSTLTLLSYFFGA